MVQTLMRNQDMDDRQLFGAQRKLNELDDASSAPRRRDESNASLIYSKLNTGGASSCTVEI